MARKTSHRRKRSSLSHWGGLRLMLRPTGPLLVLGPAWAFVAGALASGGIGPNVHTLLVLVLGLLLVDPWLGFIWTTLLETEWSSLAGDYPRGQPSATLPRPPYTTAGSPSQRLWGWLERRLVWWRNRFWPKAGPESVSLVVACLFALALAAILGFDVAILVTVALVLVAVRVVPAGRGTGQHQLLHASFQIGLAWLVGYMAFDSGFSGSLRQFWTEHRWSILLVWLGEHGPSLVLAGLYSLALYACMILSDEHLPVGGTNPRDGEESFPTDQGVATGGASQSGHGIAILNLVQLGVVGLLLLSKQPIFAGLIGLCLLPQVLFQPFVREGWQVSTYLGHIQPFLIASILLAAFAVS
ncbi:MAG: hypothetical protein ACE5NP_04360 [Anaerolineae bacterium]